MLTIISHLDFAICVRFHAHIFCSITGCPFISIANTRKVDLFLQEEGLNLNVTSNPIDKFNQVWQDRLNLSSRLSFIASKNNFCIQTKQVNNLLLR